MNYHKFKLEMSRAETFRRAASDSAPYKSAYWAGYVRGLRRAYHGEKFGTEQQHQQWMGLVNSPSEMQVEQGKGYRDGLAVEDSTPGRPKIAVGAETICLNKIAVPAYLAASMESKAAREGITMPEARRAAYTAWAAAGKDYCTQNGGDCTSCSIFNYGRDCRNNPIKGE